MIVAPVTEVSSRSTEHLLMQLLPLASTRVAVSYTHLDVYKRQGVYYCVSSTCVSPTDPPLYAQHYAKAIR